MQAFLALTLALLFSQNVFAEILTGSSYTCALKERMGLESKPTFIKIEKINRHEIRVRLMGKDARNLETEFGHFVLTHTNTDNYNRDHYSSPFGQLHMMVNFYKRGAEVQIYGGFNKQNIYLATSACL